MRSISFVEYTLFLWENSVLGMIKCGAYFSGVTPNQRSQQTHDSHQTFGLRQAYGLPERSGSQMLRECASLLVTSLLLVYE